MSIETDAIKNGTILSFEYGSRAIGTHTVDSDHDLMAIVIEPRETVIGLDEWDGSQHSTSGVGNRSTAKDTDTTTYSLRKWARLAAKGNPTVLTALYVPKYEVVTGLGTVLIESRDLFVSREAGRRHLGYMRSQRDAMVGARNKRTNRPELVHKYGYDTKFAGHMIRLGIQGIELMDTGRITIPLHEDDRKTIMSIREGKVDKEFVLTLADHLEAELIKATENSWLPDETDTDKVNRLIIDLHLDYWEHGIV